MTATKTRPARKSPQAPSRPVTEILLEIAYRLHTTKAVARPSVAGSLTGPFLRCGR